MKVKLTYLLRGLEINREDYLPAVINTNDNAQFIMWRRKVEHQGQTVHQLCFDYIVELTPPVRAEDTLLAFLENKLLLDNPIQEGLPHETLAGETVVDIRGNITPNWVIPFHLLPKGARPWFNDITLDLASQLKEFIKRLRWRQNTSGSHGSFISDGMFWSLDGETWIRFPTKTSTSFVIFQPVNLSGGARESLTALTKSGFVEPVSHDLMREARELTSLAPRSALLIAFAALETCIKTQIVRLMPDAQSLIKKMPSPSLDVLLQEIIPDLLKRKGVEVKYIPLSNFEKNYLKKWIAQRNHVTHGINKNVDPEKLRAFILFATDILYVFDYCDGHEWALKHLKSDVWTK